MYTPKEGESVEVEILDPGFEGSRWEATVKSVDLEKRTAVVEYSELLNDDEGGKLKEERDFAHVWPVPKGDWDVPLSERNVGDSVDCWCEDGWWQGVVYIACEDGLLVFFPLTPGPPEMKAVTPGSVSKGTEKVRSGVDWDEEARQWVPRPILVYEGSRDYRRKKQVPKKEKNCDDNWTDDEEEGNGCQDFSVDDFIHKKVPFPYELEREQKLSRREKMKKRQQENEEDSDEDVRLTLISSTTVTPASSCIGAEQSELQAQEPVSNSTPETGTPNPTTRDILSDALVSSPGRQCVDEPQSTEEPKEIRAVDSSKANRKSKKELRKRELDREAGRKEKRSKPVAKKSKEPLTKVSGKRARVDIDLEAHKSTKVSRRQSRSAGKEVSGHRKEQEKHKIHSTPRKDRKRKSSQTLASRDELYPVSKHIDAQPAQEYAPQPGIDTYPPRIEVNDWKQLLYKRTKLEGRFAGCCPGVKVCVDGLGWAFSEDVIARSLKEKLSGVSRVDFASGMLFGRRRYSSGYACITFSSIEYAVRGMAELDSYYLCIPGCPVARPLIAHFPMWVDNPWGMDDVPGRVPLEAGVVPPHFCQMNTIEFDSGVEWRHLRRVQAAAKKALCSAYTEEITKMIEDHLQGLVPPDRKMFTMPHSMGAKHTLWLKAVPRTMSDDYIRSVFEQFDECCKVHRLVNPVSVQEAGHILIDFEDEKKAKDVCSDMNTYLYLAGGTPRPLDVQVFDQDGPAGFESVLDIAVKKSFNVDMAEFRRDMIGHVCLRKIDTNDSARKKCSRAIRSILERMAHDRAALFLKNQEEQKELHYNHAKYFSDELHHFKVVSEAIEASMMEAEGRR